MMLVILKDTIEEDRHWLSYAPLDKIGALDTIAMT